VMFGHWFYFCAGSHRFFDASFRIRFAVVSTLEFT